MSRARWRYEDLSPRVKALVDAKVKAKAQTDAQVQAQDISIGKIAMRNSKLPNKTEACYRSQVLARRPDIQTIRYEGITLRMENGHRYTPDWIVVTKTGTVEAHEVKGGYRLHSYGRARLAFDQAAIEFPWLTWIWANKTKDGWR